MIEKKHEDCARCDWLAHEAQRTAQQLGKDAWLSLDGADHSARYTTDTEETAS
jgi:hypothetical protein